MDELSEDDKLTVTRARKMQKFLSQPFQTAEVFTGSPGKLVKLEVSMAYHMMSCDHTLLKGHHQRLQDDIGRRTGPHSRGGILYDGQY